MPTVGARRQLGYDLGLMTKRHEILDCHRLLCPMPVIRVQDAVAAMVPGDTVTAVCTDPGALHDIPAWCRINGHEVVNTESLEDEYRVTVRVCEAAE
jgi:tRNA 2-thiouridine synthesizing protein A